MYQPIAKLIFWTLICTYAGAIKYYDTLDLNDLESLFDEENCIEGTLSVRETGEPVIQSVVFDNSHPTSTSQTYTETEKYRLNNKSSMSLVQELADFNKIKIQYTLKEESGPAHKKKFNIFLQLGEEEYYGEGGSIKKAQQEAAKIALNSTLYEHPPLTPKTNKAVMKNKTSVQKLNSWAIKHGKTTIKYIFNGPSEHMDTDNNNEYHKNMYSKVANVYRVTVIVGKEAFDGEGSSKESAMESASNNALKHFQNEDSFCLFTDPEKNLLTKIFDSTSDFESPISLVHEFGSKSNMPVSFELFSEEGPSHIKKFVYKCNVGEDFEVFGEGSSKKGAKNEAAKNMIHKLKIHASIRGIKCSETFSRKDKPKKRKSKNLDKSAVKSYSVEDSNEEFTFAEELDPVSKLFQIQQSKHEVMPVFTLIERNDKEFFIEVKVNDISFVGSGPNKKAAKKSAAEGILKKLGYSKDAQGERSFTGQKKGEFIKNKQSTKKSSLVPGLDLNSENSADEPNKNSYKNKVKTKYYKTDDRRHESTEQDKSKAHTQKKTDTNHKAQLLNLSKQLGFKFQFSDFPNSKNSGFVTLLSLTTDPPKVCYGIGTTNEVSQDRATLSALDMLYKTQLNSISRMLKEEPTEDKKVTNILEAKSVIEPIGAKDLE